MRVSNTLSHSFGAQFQNLISQTLKSSGWLHPEDTLESSRYLRRSIAPHVERLSKYFNRLDEAPLKENIWRKTPKNLRLAYFLYFMPPNLFKIATLFQELAQKGFRFPQPATRAIEFGAGPGPAVGGVGLSETLSSLSFASDLEFVLIEQDSALLKLGLDWNHSYLETLNLPWKLRGFRRQLDLRKPLLPKKAPHFDLMCFSFFLNEIQASPQEKANALLKLMETHLKKEGLLIIVEPALKETSRELLAVREKLIESKKPWLKVLLPCLGMQTCGAFTQKEDWCHEVVSWWRPPYIKILDELTRLDRKELPFSYLVLSKSERSLNEILPNIHCRNSAKRLRLVSPSHKVGKGFEFYVCGQNGKQKLKLKNSQADLKRGDLLFDAEINERNFLEKYDTR